MTTDKASVAMLEALRDELRTASTEPVAGLSQRLDEVSAGLDVNALEHAGVFSPSVAPEPEYGPRPFEVRWDPTLDDGDGGWAVYLPTEHLLSYDGAEVATSDISGLTVVQDAGGNDTPWYSLDDVEEDAEHVWLVLTVPDSGPVEAEFAEEEGQAASGERVVNVCVAEIDRSMSDAAGNPVPVVRQSLVGALHLGSGGGGGVTLDDASLDWNAGGKAQIKDWDNGAPTDPNSLAAYLQGAVQPPANGLQVVARAPQQGSAPALGYVPLGALDLSEYAKKADAVPQPFDIENGYVVRCRIFAPIAEVTCSDYAINTSGGDIYVHLDRSTNWYTLSVDQTSRQNSATHAQWRLYAYSNGAPTLDLRPRILPVFELVS